MRPPAPDRAELLELIQAKAVGLFQSGALLCAPAVLVTLNRSLGGELTDRQARSVASALAEGMGGAGCTCGALSGAELAVGLFLGQRASWRRLAPPARQVHDSFKARFGSTCCRVLSHKVRHDPKLHLAHCLELTGAAAALAAEVILAARPGLAAGADLDFLRQGSSRLASGVKRLLGAA